MNAADLATEGLLSQEIESLAGCIARGQELDTYQDIVAKICGHLEKLPQERRKFWQEQCATLGVQVLIVSEQERKPAKCDTWESEMPKKSSKSTKPGGTSVP